MSQEDSISAISRVRYTDSGDVSSAYKFGQINMPNFDAKTFRMADIAARVNAFTGLSIGTDGIIKNYDIIEDYNKGGMSRFFLYNAPQQISFYSIC